MDLNKSDIELFAFVRIYFQQKSSIFRKGIFHRFTSYITKSIAFKRENITFSITVLKLKIFQYCD